MPLPPAPIDAFRKWGADRFRDANTAVIDALGNAGWHLDAEDRITQLGASLPEPEPYQAPPQPAPPSPAPVWEPPAEPPAPAPSPGSAGGLSGAIGGAFSGIGSRAQGALQGTREALAGVGQSLGDVNAAATGALNTTSDTLAAGLQGASEQTGVNDWATQAASQIDAIADPGLGSPDTYANAAALAPLPPALEGIRPGLEGYTRQLGESVDTLLTDPAAVQAGARTVQRLTPAGLGSTLGEATTGRTSPAELGQDVAAGLPALGAAASLVPLPGWQAGNVISQAAQEGALGVGLPAPVAGGIGLLADVATPDPGDVARVGRRAEALGDVAEEAPGMLGRLRGALGELPYRFGEAAREEYGDVARIVPPDVARQLPGGVRMPDDSIFREAVENTPGASIGPDGLRLDVERFQKPEQAGAPADRVFYMAGDASQYADQAAFGGSQRIAGPTLFQRPFVAYGETGGQAIGRAAEQLFGTYGASDMRYPAQRIAQTLRYDGSDVERVAEWLTNHGGDPGSAEAIVRGALSDANHADHASRLMNGMMENAIAAELRHQGFDGLVGVGGRGRFTLTEVMDAREAQFPGPAGDFALRPELQEGGEAARISAGNPIAPFMARAAQTPGERAFDLGTGVASGVAGAATGPEDQTWQQRAARGALGFAGGTLAGAHARQLGRVAGRALSREGGELAGDLARITPNEPFGGDLAAVTGDVPPVPGTAARNIGKGPLERLPEPEVPAGAREITLTPAEETARLRLDKFPDWARDTIRQGAEAGDFFRDQRRGVLPEDVQARMADDAQRSTEQWIKGGKAGRTYNTEETRALANAIAGQARAVNDLTATVNAARASGDVTDRMLAEWYTEGQKLQALTALRSGNMAEWGRVGQALRAQARAVDVSPADAAARLFAKVGDRNSALDRLAEYNTLVDNGASPAQLAGFWSRIERGEAGKGDWVSLLRYNSMLSGMPTMVVNAAGSAAELLTKYPMDVASSLARGRPGEIKAETQGALAGLRAALGPLKELGMGGTAGQIIKHGITDEAALAGGVPSSVAARTGNQAGRIAATALEAPMRLQSATDEAFNRIAYGMSAGRRAAQRATEQGLTGQAWEAEVSRLMNDLPPELAKRARADADRITFRSELEPGSVGGRIGRMRKAGGPLGEFVLPFFKTVYNITTKGVERSPLGVAGTLMDTALAKVGKGAYAKSFTDPSLVKAGVTPVGERVANNALGSLITLGFANAALDGNLSAEGPANPRDRDVLRAQGWQPYSIKVGDRWVSYSNWGPYAVPLALGAAYGEAKRYGTEGQPMTETAGRTLKGFGALLSDQPYLAGIGAIYKALEDPERYGSQWLGQTLGSLIPFGSAISSVAAAGDEYERQAPGGNVLETALGNVQARIPGMRERLPVRRDVFGDPVENTRQGLWSQAPVRRGVSPNPATEDVRRYIGTRDAAEDVRAAAAIRHVEDYIDGRTIVPPNRGEQELYARYAGNENPIYQELTGQGRALEQQAKIDAERRRLGAGSLAG